MSCLAAITVCFNPDPAILKSQLLSLPRETYKILVDNGSQNIDQLLDLKDEFAKLELICNSGNEGLARAVNQGASYAHEQLPAVTHILT